MAQSSHEIKHAISGGLLRSVSVSALLCSPYALALSFAGRQPARHSSLLLCTTPTWSQLRHQLLMICLSCITLPLGEDMEGSVSVMSA